MCDVLRIKNDADVIVEVETVGQLRQYMPKLVPDPRYHQTEFSDETCLCPIDIEKTGAANGYKILFDGVDYEAVKP